MTLTPNRVSLGVLEVAARRGYRRCRTLTVRLTVVGLVATAGAVGVNIPPAAAACAPNPVVCENSQPGTPKAQWDIQGGGDPAVQGFATDISVNVGGTISFKIDTTAASYGIDIYRLGWYGGNGARKIGSIPATQILVQHQPACITDPSTALYDCGNWAVSASWAVPSTAVSGVYLARLTLPDGGASHIPFVVRDDASTSKLFFQTSDTTWQAYNTVGGANFYFGGNNGRAYKLSYNRPISTRQDNSGRDFLFSNEYPMIRFLERNGYDVSYTSGVDSDRRGNLIKNHSIFLSVGHDEYWSGAQRANVEAARNAGVNLAFFSGNEVYWKTRWEPSTDGSNTANRTLVCYKESWADAKIDPSPEWTGTWRDPRFSPPANGGRPENALTGTAYMSNSDDLTMQVSADEGKYRLWRGTDIANLAPGQVANLAPHTVGYESDEDLDNGFRPAGLIDLSTTTGSTPEYLRDFGRQVSPGTTTHHLTLYRAASNALVFSAGTIQWSWGLDSEHDGIQSPADTRMQQATINLFADMGVQPTISVPGLILPALNTDTQPPTATITSPAEGATFANGAQVTVAGTATDVGGGVVAAVEVSTDGATWKRATGTSSWSYTFNATGAAVATIRVRAVDDSANIAPTPTTLHLNLTGATSLFGDRVPAQPATTDAGTYQLGVRFVPQHDGYVTGVRFYKGTGNNGPHTGTLWSASGTRLATGSFVNETATGWQTLTFGTRVPVTAGTTYVASYLAPQGHYAAESYFFGYNDYVAPPLTAPRSGGNGVFAGGDNFPSSSYQNTNYYVDVLFLDSNVIPPAVLSVTPTANTAGLPASTHPTAKFSKPVVSSSVQMTLKDAANAPVAGATTYDSTSRTATFTPSAALAAGRTYTATVQASDSQGRPLDSPPVWSFSTDPYPTMAKLFASDAVPALVADPTDSSPVELGVKFVPSVDGKVIGIRFYQGPGNTGTHTGSLWSASGVLLAKVTFSGETGLGWQTATFSTPVTVYAGTTYVASYYAPNGHYAADLHFFAADWTNGSLKAPNGGNGLYRYAADAFPTSTYADTNYWVDPVFDSTPPPPPPPPTPNPAGTYSLFSTSDTPTNANWNDPNPIEVGVRFNADASGTVTGARFYKGSQNTGTHNASLWSATGQRLATATFPNETASGWQTVTFSPPVAITAGTTYVVSYSSTVGYYSVNSGTFSAGLDRPPLHVPASGGVYRYGSGFPNSTTANNFWVDVLFHQGTP
jgi:hypothetical protein